ncbi:hypothetical protein C6Y14_08595 [Streptomyces dioscori]|uniref:Uncharacterized protein n=1 Tax=Streptomyces dioscori TaxID=2109333 RepID=A0A2P8QBP6_9ACTN|nr:hypothetical protein C6Y14_08595 [Streptomyces dioscori]
MRADATRRGRPSDPGRKSIPRPSRLDTGADGRHPAATGTGSSPVKVQSTLLSSQGTGAAFVLTPSGFPPDAACTAESYVTPRLACLEECRDMRLPHRDLESQAPWSNLYGGVGAEGMQCRCDAG